MRGNEILLNWAWVRNHEDCDGGLLLWTMADIECVCLSPNRLRSIQVERECMVINFVEEWLQFVDRPRVRPYCGQRSGDRDRSQLIRIGEITYTNCEEQERDLSRCGSLERHRLFVSVEWKDGN